MRVDLTGEIFGRLKVIEKVSVSRHGETMWKCSCECGNSVVVSRGNLKTGCTKSCGCLLREELQSRRKFNRYKLDSEFGVGYTNNTGHEFYFDIEDFEIIYPYSWIEKDGYIIAYDSSTKKIVRQHRIILGCSKDEIVDHKNQKRHDNRKENLRKATKQQNAINRGAGINSKSGIKGVSKSANGEKYYARISVDGKTKHLGTFDTARDAKACRQMVEFELFGEFAEGGGEI